jgi:hypothetical protein
VISSSNSYKMESWRNYHSRNLPTSLESSTTYTLC